MHRTPQEADIERSVEMMGAEGSETARSELDTIADTVMQFQLERIQEGERRRAESAQPNSARGGPKIQVRERTNSRRRTRSRRPLRMICPDDLPSPSTPLPSAAAHPR